MKPKKHMKKLIKRLPESIDEINDILDDEIVVMFDFMDGEQVFSLIQHGVPGLYKMIGMWGGEIDIVDKEHLLMNSIKS